MRREYSQNLVSFSALLICIFCATYALAGSTQKNQTSASDVQRELKETLKAIASYSADQRDAAVAKAKDALLKTDARIEKLQQQIDQNLQPMSQGARHKAQETLKLLHKQRTEIAEWYGGLKHSSTSAWDEIKKGFAKSYTELEESLEKARDKF